MDSCRRLRPGIGDGTVHGIVRWASKHLSTQRIEGRCDARNLRSRKVAEQAGFHLEAVLRQDEPDVEGLPSDTPIYVKVNDPHLSR